MVHLHRSQLMGPAAGGPAGIAYVLGIIYFGVVVSDMVR